MAVLKKIKFGESTNNIAKTVVQGKPEGVIAVTNTTNYQNTDSEDKDYSYDIDVNVDNATIVKSSGSLAVGTVPAANVSVADSAGVFTAENVETALKELKDDIAAVDGAAKSYKIVEVASPASSTSLKEYKVQVAVGDGDFVDDTASATIVVPKDNAFVTAQLGHTGATVSQETGAITDGAGEDALLIEYVNGSGVYTLVAVPIGAFLKEAEFKDGLQVNNSGEVSAKLGQGLEFGGETGEGVNQSIKVKVDSTSEKDTQSTPVDFLTVGTNGIKIQGIGAEIDRKIAALDVTTDAAVAGQYVAAIEETDGVVAVKTRANVSEAVLNNYAKGTDDAAIAATDTINEAFSKIEVRIDNNEHTTSAALNDIKDKIDGMDKAAAAVDGQVVTTVSETDGVVSETKANVKDLQLGGYAKDASAKSPIGGTDTINTALSKLENAIDAAKAAATTKVVEGTDAGNNLEITSATSQTDGSTTYTINLTDVASAQGLAAEVTRAQSAETAIDSAVGLTKAASGETRTFTPTTNYGGAGTQSAATSVMDNMQKIDTALKAVSDKADAIQYKVSGTTLEFFGLTAHA